MELIDTHFHFYGEATPPEALQQIREDLELACREIGIAPPVLGLVAAGGDYLESLRAREFARIVPRCRYAAGVHPHQAEAHLANVAAEDFAVFAGDPKLAAVGELGLDYYYDGSPHPAQRTVLERFLALALDWKLPAVIHLRDKEGSDDAYRDADAMLADFAAAGGRFVVHCFAGGPAWAERFLALGAMLGVTGMVTFRKAENIREVVRLIPSERLLIETDSPYLAPVPFRSRPNSPGFLPLVAARVAVETGVPTEEVARITTANARRFFAWDETFDDELREEEAPR